MRSLLRRARDWVGSAARKPAAAPPGYDLIPTGQYDYVPKGTYVFGPADRFLLVPKNRYRLTLLPGMESRLDHGVGWVTEANTPAGYDLLWGDDANLAAYKAEGDSVRSRMPAEIAGAIASDVRQARTAIDVGCGVGDLLAALRDVNPELRLSGCDFSGAAVAKAAARLPGAAILETMIADRLAYPDDAFDVVTMTDVLEHLERPAAIVAELVRICAPGGIVAIVVPDGAVDQFFGHLWFWTEETFPAFLQPWHATVWRLADCRELIGLIRKPAAGSPTGAKAAPSR